MSLAKQLLQKRGMHGGSFENSVLTSMSGVTAKGKDLPKMCEELYDVW